MSDFHDEFREVEGCCSETMRVNTKSMDDSRFVDRSRLVKHLAYIPSRDASKPGTTIEIPRSLADSARQAGDSMKHYSSYAEPGCKQEEKRNPRIVQGGAGPMTRKRGDQ